MMKSLKLSIHCVLFFSLIFLAMFSYWAVANYPERAAPVEVVPEVTPKDNLPHAKLPAELRAVRVLELDIGQSAWIGKYHVHIDEKSHVWVDSEGEVYFKKSDASGGGFYHLKVKRVASHCVELVLPRSHQKANPKIFMWTPWYIRGTNWKVSVFKIEDDKDDEED